MILLRLISWPYLRKHVLRWLLTIAGIVLGVAVFVGMHTANQSVLAAFHTTVNRIAGNTQIQVTAGETGFDEDVLERVQAIKDVRVAVPVIEAVVDTGLKGQGNLLVLAVDMTGDQSLRDYALDAADEDVVDDPLVFLAQPDSIIVTREFANQNNLQIDSKLPLKSIHGVQWFTVRGIMKSGGLAGAFGGNLAVMDIYAAQQVFGKGRKFDRIDIAVKEGVPVERCRAAIEAALGPGFTVEPPASRAAQYDAVVRVYSQVVNITSAFALFIGMFIIYNSFAIAVTQRRSEIGILRALGATRGQVRALFLTEGAIAGVLGSLAGLAFGVIIARAMTMSVGSLIQGVYGVASNAQAIDAEPRLLVVALVMGVVTSVVAAFIPARTASRVDPVRALQKGRYQVLSAGRNRARVAVGAVLAVAAVVLLLASSAWLLFYVGYALAMLAALFFTPSLALWLTRLLRPALRAVRPIEGTLAVDSLLQAPRRTSATVAALMLSIALVIALGGISRASYESIYDWVSTALNPDLFVTPSENITNRNYLFPASMAPELERVPGISAVHMVRSARVVLKGKPVLLVSLEVSAWATHARRHPIEGDETTMYRRAAAGEGVIVSDNLAQLKKVHLGDIVPLQSPSGILRLPVVGVVADWSDQQGAVFLDRAAFVRYWHDDTVNVFRIYLKPGASVPSVKQAILARFAGTRLFVLTNAEVRGYIFGLTDQWMGLTYSQIAVAVLVAILGIVNTLTVSIIDRRRELGVLQAVGALRNQLRHTVWMEALTIGLVGLFLGLVVGAVNLHYVLEISRRDISGMLMAYRFPWSIALFLLPVILGSAFVAAIWPAESAVRGSLVEALEYE
ncbi:MAG: FtsX-like permease family protein [Bacteroidales bacterium]